MATGEAQFAWTGYQFVILDRDFLQFTNHEPNFPWIFFIHRSFLFGKVFGRGFH
jgi:hypothetical protein